MRVSQRVTYGILAAVDLAMHTQNDAPVQARSIARRQGIPVRFLEQVLHSMKKAGLIESLRGAQGGYRLSRKPSDLTMADVMEALDGPVFHQSFANHGTAQKQAGPPELLLGHVWEQVQRAERNVLENITVDQLAARQQAIEEQCNPMYHI
jgi:Rrf2 family protein